MEREIAEDAREAISDLARRGYADEEYAQFLLEWYTNLADDANSQKELRRNQTNLGSLVVEAVMDWKPVTRDETYQLLESLVDTAVEKGVGYLQDSLDMVDSWQDWEALTDAYPETHEMSEVAEEYFGFEPGHILRSLPQDKRDKIGTQITKFSSNCPITSEEWDHMMRLLDDIIDNEGSGYALQSMFVADTLEQWRQEVLPEYENNPSELEDAVKRRLISIRAWKNSKDEVGSLSGRAYFTENNKILRSLLDSLPEMAQKLGEGEDLVSLWNALPLKEREELFKSAGGWSHDIEERYALAYDRDTGRVVREIKLTTPERFLETRYESGGFLSRN